MRRPTLLLVVSMLGALPSGEEPTSLPSAPSANVAAANGYVSISAIQGAGHISPFVGQHVTTGGIVTAIAFNGYYVQDPVGDGDAEQPRCSVSIRL